MRALPSFFGYQIFAALALPSSACNSEDMMILPLQYWLASSGHSLILQSRLLFAIESIHGPLAISLAVGSRAGHPIDFWPSSQAFYGIAASHAVKVKFPRHANFEIREKRRPGGDYQDLSRKEVLKVYLMRDVEHSEVDKLLRVGYNSNVNETNIRLWPYIGISSAAWKENQTILSHALDTLNKMG
ncbi:hypothetical protein BD769DRAFT_1636710 [Suillus cothurnatus]|nr:hypothetical protein BD769DRAFT_1636710 [Suillus cothurnatus]